jgi:hypothetical protein
MLNAGWFVNQSGTVIDITRCNPFSWHNSCIGSPQDCIRLLISLWSQCHYLQRKGTVCQWTILLTMRTMGCIIENQQLHSAYKTCGCGDMDSLCGFIHSFVNRLDSAFRNMIFLYQFGSTNRRNWQNLLKWGCFLHWPFCSTLLQNLCARASLNWWNLQCTPCVDGVWTSGQQEFVCKHLLDEQSFTSANCLHAGGDPVDIAVNKIGKAKFVCNSVFEEPLAPATTSLTFK